MLARREAIAFPWLRHDVADIDFRGIGSFDRFDNSWHQQIWNDASEHAAGSNDNEVGILNSLQRTFMWVDTGRFKKDFADSFARLNYGRLAAYLVSIVQKSAQSNVLQG